MGKAWEPATSSVLLEIEEHWIEMYLHFFSLQLILVIESNMTLMYLIRFNWVFQDF
jgi:hypothetical protein